MKTIELVEKFELGGQISSLKDKEVREIYNGARRRMVEVKLRENAVLTRHKTPEPISVLCLAGKGVFTAGANLEDRLDLSPGVLLTLEGGIEHEVAATPEIHILVTKFKDI
jgi:quercetin dioxygenase-like cupin family protein